MLKEPLKDPIKCLFDLMNLKSDIDSHFHMFSPVSKAIKNYISSITKGNGHAFDLEKRPLHYWRGVGPVNIIRTYCNFESEKNGFFYMDIEIAYKAFEDEPSTIQSDDGEDVIERRYTVSVPIDLELNFSPEKFNKWIEETKEKTYSYALKKAQEKYNKLNKSFSIEELLAQ